MEENPRTDTFPMDPQSTRSPHLILESSPQTPSSISSSESKTNWATEKYQADTPVRSSVSSGHATFDHGSAAIGEKSLPTVQDRAPVPETNEGMTKMNPDRKYGGGGPAGVPSGSGQRTRQSQLILSRGKREKMVKRFELGCRLIGCLFSLVSFSLMAADRNMGWALDSFFRYKEFRYSMSVSVIVFVYSAAQSSDLGYHLATGKPVFQHSLRYYFDFALDQMITYLLISASSSAATRIDDWQSNWGKDKFPDMATASVLMSFLAFVAQAFASLISGYMLCNFMAL